MRRRWRVVGALAVVAVALVGCGDDDAADDGDAAASSTSSTEAMSAFVTEVNARCEAMIPEIEAINGDEQEPQAATYVEKQGRKQAVYEVFDAEVEALPVGPDDERAAAAFTAYRADADADAATLTAAATSGDAAQFDATYDELTTKFMASPITAELRAVGIVCPAR